MSSRAAFRQKLIDAFGINELVTLCADLGIDADLIPGRDNGKEFWAEQIIEYFERRKRIPDLVNRLQAVRNNVTWDYQPEPGDAGARVFNRPLSTALSAATLGLAAVLVFGLIAYVASRRDATVTPTVAPTQTVASATTVPTVTAAPAEIPSATPKAPQAMPSDHFNILFTEFGLLDQGVLRPLPEGKRLSQSAADGLKTYLAEGLPPDVKADFPPLVWHSGDAAERGWQITAMSNPTEAQRLADSVGAQMVIYGNFVVSGTNSQLELGFYVAKVANAADEIVGPYQLGAPITVRWPMNKDVEGITRLSLNERNRLLSRFALGLAYDLFGKQLKALEVFQSANSAAPSDYRAGREVLYFFIGREHLLLQQTEQAEKMHRAALDLNPGYARAHVGLGDVYLQYAAVISDAQKLLQSDTLSKSEEQYALAESLAALTPDVPQLAPLARLGLGLVKQTRAKAHFDLDATEVSQPLALDATRLIEPALVELARRPDGQRRTLALGYLSLAEAYWISARMAAGLDGASADQLRQRDAFYASADIAYNACINLDIGTDEYLTKNIVSGCKVNQRRMSAELP